MISPYVRRLRLAAELQALRAQARMTHDQLSKRSGETKAQISRLENGHVVDQASVMKILDVLGVEGDRWTQIMTITREAAEKGWWESTRGMGDRQALYANLEAGATSIREYQQTFVPGLLQTPEFVQARWDSDAALGPLEFSVEGILAGSSGRQRMLRRPGAPAYEVIIDEAVIRRLSAPPDAFKRQLDHLVQTVNGDAKLALRVLPIDARIAGYTVPRCSFSLYTYADPGDPVVVAADSVTFDLVLTEPADVTLYERLYAGLRQAALPQDESLDLLAKAAAELPET
jgi:transcriptional regulator with XRE-family HTH domain